MSGGDVLGVVVLAAVAGLGALVLLLVRRRQSQLATFAARVADRFGITDIRSEGLTTQLSLERPGWSGVVRVYGRPRSAAEIVHFTGVARAPRSAWSLSSRRLLGAPGPGAQVPLESPALRDRFVLFAERPEETRRFFDADVERWLTELDAGAAHALVGALPGIAVSVQGTEMSVMVSGQQGEDEEHLRTALLLIERVAERG